MKTSRYLTIATLVSFLGIPSLLAQEEAATNPIVVMVNGAPLYEVEVRQIYDNLLQTVAQQGREAEPERLQKAAFEQGVGMKLLVQEAARRGIEVDNTEIDGILQELEKDAGGSEAMAEGLIKNGLTLDDLRRAVTEQEAIRRFMEGEIEPTIQVSDEELSVYYEGNTERFTAPEMVHARHMLFKPDSETGDDAVTATRTLAAAARARAIAGEDFSELAKELSQGPSAESGGDLGFFAAEQMAEPFSKAAFALEIGGISDVVETQFGFHVIKVEDKRAAGVRPLAEIAEPLRNMMLQQKLAASVQELLGELRAKAELAPATPQQPEAGS